MVLHWPRLVRATPQPLDSTGASDTYLASLGGAICSDVLPPNETQNPARRLS